MGSDMFGTNASLVLFYSYFSGYADLFFFALHLYPAGSSSRSHQSPDAVILEEHYA